MNNKVVYMPVLASLLIGCIQKPVVKVSGSTVSSEPTFQNKLELGEALFLDENMSLNRGMSCASCHDPKYGFIDSRLNEVDGAASLGQDGISLGDRNSPMIPYASFTPSFRKEGEEYIGGQFLDGRAQDLVEQAGLPFLDPVEMQMPNAASVIERVRENEEYVKAFKSLYGEKIFDNTSRAFRAVANSISTFEKSEKISPFDSKFDRGELNAQEVRGRALFISARCNFCHIDSGERPLFTDHKYQNLGLPENTLVRSLNGKANDLGLFGNSKVNELSMRGKFRVSSLRNVSVTPPYMHNGVFKELKTVVHFYNTRDVPGAINPETGNSWGLPEVPENVNTFIGNLGLSDADEDDIVAFLRTLTDRRYESLD